MAILFMLPWLAAGICPGSTERLTGRTRRGRVFRPFQKAKLGLRPIYACDRRARFEQTCGNSLESDIIHIGGGEDGSRQPSGFQVHEHLSVQSVALCRTRKIQTGVQRTVRLGTQCGPNNDRTGQAQKEDTPGQPSQSCLRHVVGCFLAIR